MSVGVCVLEKSSELPQFRLVLLHDSEGKALALLPAHSLLNLVEIWKQTDRQLKPVKGEDAKRYFSQDALKYPDGQAKLLSLKLFLSPDCLQPEQMEIVEPYSGLNFIAIAEQLKMGQRIQLSLTYEQINDAQPEGSDEAIIGQAVERFTVLRMQQRLEDTLGLPSLSPTMKKIIVLRSDPDASMSDLVSAVRLDPSLSAQVMSWAASPYYAAPGDVASIDDAIIRVLGFDLVINMALGTAMGQLLKLPADLPRGATPYWIQAVYNANLAEKLCYLMSDNQHALKPGFVYLSGLLHNFSYLVLAHLFPPHFALLSRYIEANPHFALDTIEKQILSVTREQIGSWLLTSWDLPESVTTAIRQQNDPEYAGKYNLYAKLLYLSNRLLRQQGLSDGPVEQVDDTLYDELGLDKGEVDKAVRELVREEGKINELTVLIAVD